jgi:hypothetical protein
MVRKALLGCGIVASVIYVAATIIGAMVWKDYSTVDQSVSELFAIDAPSKAVVDPLLITYSVLWIAFGVGVWQSASRNRALRIAAVGLIGKEAEGLVVQLFFPMHLRGVQGTTNDPVHGILTYLGVLCFLIGMGFGAMAFGNRFRIYTIATLLACLAGAILSGLQIPQLAANQPTPLMGVYERVTIFGYLLWGAVLAIGLLRAQREQSQKNIGDVQQVIPSDSSGRGPSGIATVRR